MGMAVQAIAQAVDKLGAPRRRRGVSPSGKPFEMIDEAI